MAKRKLRLKKGPEIADFVVEEIFDLKTGKETQYSYHYQRKEARLKAKASIADRVRIFHCKFNKIFDKKLKI